MDPCSGLPLYPVFCFFEQGDQRLAPGLGLGKFYGSLYLWQHGSRRKVSFINVLLCLVYGDVSQPFLSSFARRQLAKSLSMTALAPFK